MTGQQLPQQVQSSPNPDPTILTTQALFREIKHIEDSMAAAFKEVEILSTEKFRRVEQQFELVERQRVEQKKDTKDAVDAALTAQKEAVKEQTAASERAIAKSEEATRKQLEQLSNTFTTAFEGMRRSIDETKERISEADKNLRAAISEVDRKTNGVLDRTLGATDSRVDTRAGATQIWNAVAVVIAALAIVAGILLAVLHK